MQIVGALVWWYSDGLVQASRRVALRLDGLLDYFSIGLLLRTLFSPFRQISASSVENGSLDAKMHALLDNLISRCIGAAVRVVVLLIGVVSIIVGAGIGLLFLVFWAAVPFIPIIGLILALTGWIPWKII